MTVNFKTTFTMEVPTVHLNKTIAFINDRYVPKDIVKFEVDRKESVHGVWCTHSIILNFNWIVSLNRVQEIYCELQEFLNSIKYLKE